MEQEEGDYITVDKKQFAECRMDVIVKDGKLERIKTTSTGKLVPSTIGQGTHQDDVSIIGTDRYWSFKTYE